MRLGAARGSLHPPQSLPEPWGVSLLRASCIRGKAATMQKPHSPPGAGAAGRAWYHWSPGSPSPPSPQSHHRDLEDLPTGGSGLYVAQLAWEMGTMGTTGCWGQSLHRALLSKRSDTGINQEELA